MPIREDGYQLLSLKSVREARLCLRYLQQSKGLSITTATSNNLKAMENEAATLSKRACSTIKEHDLLVDQIRSFTENELIPDQEFNWLKGNDFACHLAWSYIRIFVPANTAFEETCQDENQAIYDDLQLNPAPINTKEKLSIIISFFDLTALKAQKKRQFLHEFKKLWRQHQHESKSLKWIDQANPNQLEWLPERLLSHKLFVEKLYNPINPREQYLCIISMILLATHSPEAKELALIKIKKAWSQKKFRDKQKDKAPINTHVRKEIKKKLELLAAEEGINMTEMLERLINKEYEQTTA